MSNGDHQAAGLEVRVPDIGDFSDVDVIDVLVSAGDQIEAEQPLVTLETDKAAMDVPAPAAGLVAAVHLSAGDKVSEGDLVITLASEVGATGAGDAQGAPPAEAAVAEVPSDTSGETDAAVTEFESAGSPVPLPAGASGEGGAPGQRVEVRVPDMGDFADVEIIDVLVSPGETVAAEAPLITLETDKAAMDVPAPADGEVTDVHVSVGDRVSEGDLIAHLVTAGGAAAATDASQPASGAAGGGVSVAVAGAAPAAAPDGVAAPTPAPAASASPPAAAGSAAGTLPAIDEAGFARAHAGPSVRRFARELGVDLTRIKGSGLKGRITEGDVKAFVKAFLTGTSREAPAAPALPAVPPVDFARFGPVEQRPLTRIQKISGPRLHASWVNVPHVTQFDSADITELEATRKRLKPVAAEQDAKLTPLAFLVRACALVLGEFEVFKSSLDENSQSLVMKGYTHIGFAADTPNGLVVPVIQDADQKDVFAIARELGELASLARDGKLKAAQMQGGVFTISSLGGIGGTAFTPIINAPEVAILGVSRSDFVPVYDGEQFLPRLMLPLSLSYDHRVIDGAAAVRFTTRLGEMLAEVNGLLPEEHRA